MNKEDLKTELDRLASLHNGLLRPQDVVAYAEAEPDSLCHQWFTWDDTEAARLHRLNEARALIRVHVRLEPGESGETRVRVREYVSLSSDRVSGGGYRNIDDVLRNADLIGELVTDALRELERLRTKYQQLNELRGVFAEIDAALERNEASQA